MFACVCEREKERKGMYLRVTSDSNAAERRIGECLASMLPDGCHSFKKLDCADFVIETSERVLMVERKSVLDFASSVCDNRLDSQLDRMQAVAQGSDLPTDVAILLCGRPPFGETVGGGGRGGAPAAWGKTKLRTSSFYGKLNAVQLKRKIPVLWTDDAPEEVAMRLFQLGRKMLEETSGDDPIDASKPPPYANSMVACGKRKRSADKDNLPEVKRAMLLGIPGMSTASASAILDKWPKLSKLRKADPQEVADLLVGKRKLGPALAKRVCSTFA